MVVHRYLTPEFRERLRRKAYQHLINADFRHQADGTRFGKDLVETPLYLAIGQLCRPGRLQPVEEAMDGCDWKAIQIINHYVIAAICSLEPGKLRDLATMLELHTGTQQETAKHIPWIYFAGSAALAYLDAGTLPTKRQVIEDAIARRAFFELWCSPSPVAHDPRFLTTKTEDITRHRSPRVWRHVFRVLDLTELPHSPRFTR